jgi:phosphate transport system substrate-binding protein
VNSEKGKDAAYGQRVMRILATVSLGACVPGVAWTQQVPQRDGLEVQKARTEHVSARAKKVFYTRTFDLSGLPEYKPEQAVSGTIREWGSNYPADSDLNANWVKAFTAMQPKVSFNVQMHTALEAAPALATGVADIAACRLFTFSEEELFERKFNHEPLRILIATGSYNVPGWSPALAVVTNKDNPIQQLTMEQLDRIFGAARTGGYIGTTWHPEYARSASEDIRTWGQLGLTGKWKDAPIHVYGLNLEYGMARDFQQAVFYGGDKWSEGLREYANYAAPDGTLKIAADQLMQDIGKDPYAIGYSGAMFLTPQTKMLAIAEKPGGPFVPLTMDTVQERRYPLLLDLYFYLDREPGKPVDPKLKEFLRFLLSRQGQELIERDGKYLPLTKEAVEGELRKLE